MIRTILRMTARIHGEHNNPAPVKFMFPLFLGIAALLGASTLSLVPYSYIRIEPSKTTLETGERFSINVYASAHVPVNAVTVSLAFPTEVVEIEGVDIGESVITLWTQQPYVKDNRVYLEGGTFKRGFIGEHRIATIKAIAKSTGPAEFSVADLNLLAGDGKGTTVLSGKPESSQARLTIIDPNADAASITAEVNIIIATDINTDGKVTLTDISSFLAAWQTRTAVYDFNNDGKMTFKDFGIILSDSFIGGTR